MRVRNVMMFAVLMASVLCARSSYALLHGPENPDDAQRVIDRAVAEHQFAVKQAQEREAMKIKNQEQIQKRFEELYKPSEANAHLPSPGVVAAGQEPEAIPDTSGTNTLLILWGLVILGMVGGGGYIYHRTRTDKRLREERRQQVLAGKKNLISKRA